MRLGVAFHCPSRTEAVLDNASFLARQSEDLGFDAFWLLQDPAQPFPADLLTAMTFVAPTTSSIRLGVWQQADRHPVRMAEDVAVLDCICNGRTEIVLSGEDAASLEEYLSVCRGAWELPALRYRGKHYAAPADLRQNDVDPDAGINVMPKPVQLRLPLWAGVWSDEGTGIRGPLARGPALFGSKAQAVGDAVLPVLQVADVAVEPLLGREDALLPLVEQLRSASEYARVYVVLRLVSESGEREEFGQALDLIARCVVPLVRDPVLTLDFVSVGRQAHDAAMRRRSEK